MKRINYGVIFLILIFLAGCKGANNNQLDNKEDEMTNPEDIRDVRVTEWYKSEEYNRDVIDIINFDDIERTVNVTTICYDKDENILPSNDSYVLKLQAKYQQTWLPDCPRGTVSYSVDIIEIFGNS